MKSGTGVPPVLLQLETRHRGNMGGMPVSPLHR
jgi:hypothetical protein